MKALFIACLFVSPFAFATSVTIKSDDTKAELQPLPQKTLSILTDAGLKLKAIGNGVFELRVEDIHCDSRHRGALESTEALAGIETLTCRYNSRNAQDTTAGRRLREAHDLSTVLGTLENDGSIFFTDCAMGYCGTWVPSIVCTVDTKIEEFVAGRFQCTYTDGN